MLSDELRSNFKNISKEVKPEFTKVTIANSSGLEDESSIGCEL